VQTFVFSATLTLPTSLRKRLRRGGGGAMGGAGFEKLMDKWVACRAVLFEAFTFTRRESYSADGLTRTLQALT